MSPTQKRTFRVVVVVRGVLLALSVVALAFAQDPAPQPRAPRTSNPERLPTEASAEELAASAGRSGPAWMPPPDGMREAQLRRLGRITEDMSEAEVAAVLKADAQSLVKRFGQPQPNPRAHAKLMANEKAALAAGKTPKAMGLALTGEAQVLAVMTEHSGPDTFTQPYPDTAGGTECITPTEPLVFEGPRFNEIPNPAGTGDNWTFWVEDYSPELLHEMLFGQGPEAGVQERVRPDLRDPNDGRRGIDLRGQTMANFYLDVSQGLYTVDGEVHTVTLPHSLAWYGADECVPGQGAGFNDLYGPAWKMAVHSARELNEKYPGANRGTNADFDWRDWDTDKDGYVDHFFIVHAGVGEASGGGNLDAFSMWAHSWDVNFAPGEGPGLGGMQVMSPTADYPQGVWLLN
ncbi:MAG TPA: immune inhibitor A domain-containing protein [Ardenticatenaceae bacterium]|nr:immune inhibitor A domain-containing protein [Ardenticatenaceae bacterium]